MKQSNTFALICIVSLCLTKNYVAPADEVVINRRASIPVNGNELLAISPSHEFLAVKGHNSASIISSTTLTSYLLPLNSEVIALAFTKDNYHIVVIHKSGLVQTFNWKTKKQVAQFSATKGHIAAFSHGAEFVTVYDRVGANLRDSLDVMEIWSVKNQQKIAQHSVRVSPEMLLEFSNQNKYLLSFDVGAKGSLFQFGNGLSLKSEHLVELEKGHGLWGSQRASFSEDKNLLVIGGVTTSRELLRNEDGSIKSQITNGGPWVHSGHIELWSLSPLERLRSIELTGKAIVKDVSISPEGSVLGVAFADSFVGLWELPSGKRMQLYQLPFEKFSRLAFINEGILVTLGTSNSRDELIFWDVKLMHK